jgi:hypothetical protein
MLAVGLLSTNVNMRKKVLTVEQRFAKLFPTRAAWAAADAAVDALSPKASMIEHNDTWIAAYVKAGGKRETFED